MEKGKMNELVERRNSIPYRIFMLRQEFDREIRCGSPEGAERCRGGIRELELEGKQLENEIKSLSREVVSNG